MYKHVSESHLSNLDNMSNDRLWLGFIEGRDRSMITRRMTKNSLSARGRYGPDVARWLARELQKRHPVSFYGSVTRERTPITFDELGRTTKKLFYSPRKSPSFFSSRRAGPGNFMVTRFCTQMARCYLKGPTIFLAEKNLGITTSSDLKFFLGEQFQERN